eukprot:s5848_g2.t1
MGIDATAVAPSTAFAPAPITRKAPPGAESLYKAPPSMHKAPPSGASEWPPRESSRPPAPPLPTPDVPPTSKPAPPQFKAPPTQSMAQPAPASTAQTSSPQAKPVPKKAPPVYTPAPVVPKPPPNEQIPSKAPPASARLREPWAGQPQAPAPCKTKAPPAALCEERVLEFYVNGMPATVRMRSLKSTLPEFNSERFESSRSGVELEVELEVRTCVVRMLLCELMATDTAECRPLRKREL